MEKPITAKKQFISLRKKIPVLSHYCQCMQLSTGECLPAARGKCLNEGIVYQAIVPREDGNDEGSYVRLTEGKLKRRYANRNTSLRYEKYRNSTVFSKEVWCLKDADKKFPITM